MRTILLTLLSISMLVSNAQPSRVTESVVVSGQTKLDLEFTFANDIVFKLWDKKEVLVEVDVEIRGGKHNDIFTLSSSKRGSTIRIEMDEDMWDKVEWNEWNNKCYCETRIDYTVYLPKDMEVEANTISGDYELEYFGKPLDLKTISGAIDVTVPSSSGLEFRAKTISGEVYSDLDIEFPYGKEGLRQIVGQKVYGRISNGGPECRFETISGDIFLRKG